MTVYNRHICYLSNENMISVSHRKLMHIGTPAGRHYTTSIKWGEKKGRVPEERKETLFCKYRLKYELYIQQKS